MCFFFVCPSRYDARHRKPRRCVYALNLEGTGISSPDSFNFRSSFRFRSRSRSRSRDKNPPGPGHPTSGDIFYCSGSRQLNHSSLCLFVVLFVRHAPARPTVYVHQHDNLGVALRKEVCKSNALNTIQ